MQILLCPIIPWGAFALCCTEEVGEEGTPAPKAHLQARQDLPCQLWRVSGLDRGPKAGLPLASPPPRRMQASLMVYIAGPRSLGASTAH